MATNQNIQSRLPTQAEAASTSAITEPARQPFSPLFLRKIASQQVITILVCEAPVLARTSRSGREPCNPVLTCSDILEAGD